ncbi:hypothetical protein DEM28_30185, partial [Enterobacter mori]
AKWDLLITSALAVDERETRNQQRGFTTSAKQTQEAEDGKPESRQYSAGIAYDVASTSSRQRTTSQGASEVEGASVSL